MKGQKQGREKVEVEEGVVKHQIKLRPKIKDRKRNKNIPWKDRSPKIWNPTGYFLLPDKGAKDLAVTDKPLSMCYLPTERINCSQNVKCYYLPLNFTK